MVRFWYEQKHKKNKKQQVDFGSWMVIRDPFNGFFVTSVTIGDKKVTTKLGCPSKLVVSTTYLYWGL